MSNKHIAFRVWYFLRTLALWMSHGGPLCKRLLSWDLWNGNARIDYQEGTFGMFVRWIISGEIFKKLEKES